MVISIDKDHNDDDRQEADTEAETWAPAGRDLQDARRARGLRQGRSGHSSSSGWRKAIDIAHGAGIDKVGLMTREEWRPDSNMRKLAFDPVPWPRWRSWARAARSCSRAISSTRACRPSGTPSIPEAVEKFKTAVELDPTFTTARLYLATAYMQQYIPGAESPENMQMAKAAYDQFMTVMEQDPKNNVAIASIASLFLNEKKWSDARQWYEKLTAVDPKNADAYYSLGFIAWSEWYPEYGTARANLGMKQDDPGPIKDKKVRDELKAKWEPVIDDGLQGAR